MCAASLLLIPCCAMQEVKASGLKPDTALLNALIRALGSGGLAKEAQGVFRTMVSCSPARAGSAINGATQMSLWSLWERQASGATLDKLAAMAVGQHPRAC